MSGFTAIIDYGVGNLFSLKSSLAAIGEEAVVTSDPEVLKEAARVILPGVGAFADAAKKLRDTGLVELIKEMAQEKPLLGICLGMQMLFEKSFEYGEHEGLGLIPGNVVPLEGAISHQLKVPHIGWNKLRVCQKDPLLKDLPDNPYVYYVHSFCAATHSRYITGVSEYGIDVVGCVRNGNVYGAQFHPEKSGEVGLAILRAFCSLR